MAATIGGTALSTYGLRLATLGGNMDLPAYKSILEISDLHADLRKTQENKVRIKLYGFYATKAAMITAIGNFKTKIQSAVTQTWVFSDYDFSETCFVKDEIRIQIHKEKNVEINLTLNITV